MPLISQQEMCLQHQNICKMGRSSHVKRLEMDGMYFEAYPEMLTLFRNAGWEPMF